MREVVFIGFVLEIAGVVCFSLAYNVPAMAKHRQHLGDLGLTCCTVSLVALLGAMGLVA